MTHEGMVVQLAIGILAFHGATLLLTMIFLKEEGMSWRQGFGFGANGLGRDIGVGVLVGVMFVPIAGILMWLSSMTLLSFSVQPEIQTTVKTVQEAVSITETMWMAVTTILIVPAAEEIFFRGIIYPTVKQFGFPRVALWGNALLFAAFHVNAMTFAPLAVLALVLTLLYEWSDDLLVPIIAHATFNAANFIQLAMGAGWIAFPRP